MSIQASFGIKTGSLCFVGNQLQRSLLRSIVLAQKLTGKLLLICNESFIVAKVLQYCSAIQFFLCIYKIV